MVPAEKESAEDNSGGAEEAEYSVDARILMMRKGSRRSQKEVLEWQTGASRYGQDIKGMPVESVVLVRDRAKSVVMGPAKLGTSLA